MFVTKASVAAACAGIVATTAATYGAPATTPSGTTSAEASAGWGPVVTLLRRPQVSRPDVVVDAEGTTTVVWSASGSVTATRKPAGRTWGRRVVIGHGVAPQAGIDERGTVTVVWIRDREGFGPQVMAARRTAHGPWGPPVEISAAVSSPAPSVHGAFIPNLAVSRGGAVVVTWLREPEDSGAARVQARYRPAGAGWGGIATLSPVEANSPVAAIDATGRPVIVYTVDATAFAVRRLAGQWREPVRIGRHVEPPQVAVDDAGDIVVVWEAFVPASGVFEPQAVTRPVGGPWSDPVTLDSTDYTEPVVASGPHGFSTAAWVRSDGEVVVSTHPVDGVWSAPKPIAPAGVDAVPSPPFLQIRVGRSGAALVSWTRVTTTSYVEAAYRPAEQTWLPPTRISPLTLRSSAARGFAYSRNRAVLVWRGISETERRVQARLLQP
jgi:hypothetical protein